MNLRSKFVYWLGATFGVAFFSAAFVVVGLFGFVVAPIAAVCIVRDEVKRATAKAAAVAALVDIKTTLEARRAAAEEAADRTRAAIAVDAAARNAGASSAN